MATYIAQLIAPEGIRQTLEFEAANDSAAAQATNDDLDPLNGLWASAKTGPSTGSGLRVPGHEMMLSLPTLQAWAADFAEIRAFFNSL
ncbi:hypothetical protein [Thiolapillus sp.]|uniref:hypothetical protein n=1 Tax=Thiolapillus sp. TaxID=2017437 RepID=UPI003AF7C45E